MTCVHCNDTGSLSKSLDGYIDCGYCDVAGKRYELERWYFKAAAENGVLGAMWLLHQKLTAGAAGQRQGEVA